MRVWCRGSLFASTSCAGLFFVVVASAQTAPPLPPPPPPRRQNPQLNLRRDEAGGADAHTARARARANDCAGALASFDAAIRTNIDPTLRRDRGLCHEKLGNPFPAMDD